jgi:hypothetical protein
LETISGLTNWRLAVRREADGITILRALTCDRRAVLPDELFGLPVTELADRALAVGAQPLEGEEVLVLGGAESDDWNNRNITALTLPRHLKHIGDYAFMNLRAMETLCFYDDLLTTGSASFMNCRSFSRIELTRTRSAQGPALASILRALQQELDVTIHRADGGTLRLIFPEYIENYTENSPAHYFQLKISGGGYAYHGVFRDKTLSVSDYDALWRDYLAAEHDDDSALRLAFCRLRWPAELGGRAREAYAAYLRAHLGAALSYALRERDAQGLNLLLGLGEPDAATVDLALEEARSLKNTEATAILLESRHRLSSGRGRRFAL